MDFTREPLVETIITPKEGFKLTIRASHGSSDEEYSVGAVEVVSFGNCYFFRSLEKPKAFLLPMTAYEVVEARETRAVLKKPQVEKSIKIAGGKKSSSRLAKNNAKGEEEPKKREKKHTRRKKAPKAEETEKTPPAAEQAAPTPEGEAPPPRRTLLPPPSSLISDQIDRYKDYLVEQGDLPQKDAPAEEEKVVSIAEEAPASEDKET